MASEHAAPEPVAPHGHGEHGSVEMPRPTVAPLVVSLGMGLLAAGVAFGVSFLIAGLVLLAFGLAQWSGNLLPGRGHVHEALAPPEQRAQAVAPAPGTVAHLREGMVGYRFRLPLEVHPVSAGIKGGIVGGVLIVVPAVLWGIFSGHRVWYPINLLSGMVLPMDRSLTDEQLVQKMEEFNFGMLVAGVLIHATTSVIIGLMYGVLLPTLPDIPQSMAWAALLAPILWTAASYVLMGVVNPLLQKGVSWPWFIASQFVYGVVMAVAVVGQTGHHRPAVSGVLGGLLGGALMVLPAILWGLGTGKGVLYPVNLLAGMVFQGMRGLDADDPSLTQFHADWFVTALVLHAGLSAGFGVAYALLAPRLRPISAPLAWGGLLFPILWTALSYALMGVVNPVFQKLVDWPWFIVSQFVFGVAASVVVDRSEKVYIPPKGRGQDRVADFVTG